jgi:cell filamentation protein
MSYSVEPLTDNCYEGTACLINKLNIRDSSKLKEVEGRITFAKTMELEKESLKDGFNEDDYRAIHKAIFEPLYDWAGEYRTIDISKKGTFFAEYNIVPELLRKCLERMRNLDYFRGLSFDEFIEEIVDIYCSTNFIHPFREGNGRTQRVFITQLIRYNGYEISFSTIDTDYLMLATIKSAQGVTDYLKEIFRENIKPAS